MDKNQLLETQKENMKALQELAQAKTKYRNDLFKSYLKNKRFEVGVLSKNWKLHAKKAIFNVAPYTQQVSLEEFAEAMSYNPEESNEPTLLQFGILSNCIESVSACQLKLCESSYCDFIKEALEYIKIYTSRIDILRKECEEETEKEFKSREAAIQHKLSSHLQPVKAEA